MVECDITGVRLTKISSRCQMRYELFDTKVTLHSHSATVEAIFSSSSLRVSDEQIARENLLARTSCGTTRVIQFASLASR